MAASSVMWKRRVTNFFLISMLVSSCGTASFREEKTLPLITLSQADNGSSISIRQGEMMEISLNENPSTGFRWSLEKTDVERLTLLSSDYIPADSSEVGRGGKRIWRFKAGSPGDVHVALKRWREWEGDKSTVERFEINLRVNP